MKDNWVYYFSHFRRTIFLNCNVMLNIIDKCTEVYVQKIFYFLHITFVLRIKIQLIQQNQSKAPVLQCIVPYACVCPCLCLHRQIWLEIERAKDKEANKNRRKHKKEKWKKSFLNFPTLGKLLKSLCPKRQREDIY